MPDYKRKRTHTGRRKRAKSDAPKPQVNIELRRRKKPVNRDITQDDSIRVIRGKKGEKRRRLYIISGVAAALVITVIILSIIAPVSLFESVQNFTKSIGSGSLPADISGNEVLDCVPKSNYYYVLTDTSLMTYTNGGKKIYSFVHGFSSPVLVTSQTRALLFDQGKNSAVIYNLAGVVATITQKNNIIAADITKDGEYALVTKSDAYANTVSVFDRKDKSLYSINLAKDLVNHVDLSSSGKKVAVATINSESGKIVSGVRIYDYNSADPVYKLDLGQETVYDIENTGSGFFVTTRNKSRYIKWSDYTTTEYDFDGDVASLRYSNSGFLVLYNKTNDKSNGTAVLLSNRGKKISGFEIKGIINDIRFSRGRVYTMGDNKVAIYDKEGELLRSGSCSFGGVKIAVTGSNSISVITDGHIEETAVEKG